MSLQHLLHRILGIRKAQKKHARIFTCVYQVPSGWAQQLLHMHFAYVRAPVSRSKYGLEDWVSCIKNLRVLHILPHCTQTSSGKKKNKHNKIPTQNNQARGQCLQRSHSHCSEKTSHLHHSPHAISFRLAEFCLWGPAPDVLYLQMPGVPHPGDQQPELFSMSCNYCSRMEKGWMCQGGNHQGKWILDRLNLLQITMKTLIWIMQVERQYGTEVTSLKYFYLLIFSPLCTRLNAKQQSSNTG